MFATILFVKIIFSLHLSSNFTFISNSLDSLEKDLSLLKCPIFASFFYNFSISQFEFNMPHPLIKYSWLLLFFVCYHILLLLSSSQKNFHYYLHFSAPFSALQYCWSIVTLSQIATHNSSLFVSLEKDLSLKCSIFDTLSYHHLSIPQFKKFFYPSDKYFFSAFLHELSSRHHLLLINLKFSTAYKKLRILEFCYSSLFSPISPHSSFS